MLPMSNFDYTREEIKLFRKLNSPAKVQDFVNTFKFDFSDEYFYHSPREVLKRGKADCVEGAFLAAAILEFNDYSPLVLDLRCVGGVGDYDHVVAVWKQFGAFGAISKTNHGVLRYREPVYKTIRELALSYFHEYFLDTGRKTLREYSEPFDLSRFDAINWRTTEGNLSEIVEHLDTIKHHTILSPEQIKNLRKADPVEIEAGKIVEFKISSR